MSENNSKIKTMTVSSHKYPEDSVGRRMTANVPVCHPHDSFEKLVQNLFRSQWDSISNVFVIDNHRKLLGYIDLRSLTNTNTAITAEKLMQPAPVTLRPDADQESVIYNSITHDIDRIPITDEDDHFLGVITAKSIIDIMHEEHLEDLLLSAGLRSKGRHLIKLASAETWQVIKIRAPWLVVGLLVGLGLGFITSSFEATLEKSLALAFFIPVITYIADSVGTQSEAITVRALASTKISNATYILKESIIGSMLGIFMGVAGALGALLISKSYQIAAVVGLTLVAASLLAAVLGAAIPLVFKKMGKDPALGSGPLATAAQDVISILIYFVFASLIIH